MQEILMERKAELEIAAKNTIVDIHLIRMNAESITKTLEAKEKLLAGIDSALRELEYMDAAIKMKNEVPE